MGLPTIEDVLNDYLYGQTQTASPLTTDSLIRPNQLAANPAIVIDTQDYMSTGAGRFAVGAQFNIVEDFFTDHSLPTGSYTKPQLATRYGLSYYGWNDQQHNWQDSTDDYLSRTFINGSTAFKIGDNSNFVVDAAGNHSITNFNVVPDGNDNFDTKTDNWFTNFANTPGKAIVDPSSIGRTVDLDFSGTVPTSTYTLSQY